MRVTERNRHASTLVTLALYRRLLLVLLLLGLVGTGGELLLMEHTEDVWQLMPLMLIGASLATLAWYGISKAPTSLRVLQVIMFLSAAVGVLGSILHYRGNVEFELEMSSGLKGAALFKEAMMGATPALAPGAMILLGALGLLYTYRHPILHGQSTEE